MKIYNASQIRKLDKFTIENEPIASIDLMERASRAFVENFIIKFGIEFHVLVFCGTGNNGGDGLAIARMLHQIGYDLSIFVIGDPEKGSCDFKENLSRLKSQLDVNFPTSINEIEIPNLETIVGIDALFGSGLNREIQGFTADVIQKMNNYTLVSVDIASGLFADIPSSALNIVKPKYTISFELPKLAFFILENQEFVGNWEVIKIGLSEKFNDSTDFFFTTPTEIKPKPRNVYGHKGTFGHAYLVAGSYGMMGAAVLASKACLRSGVGKVTTHTPKKGMDILQIAVPEAIVEASLHENQFSAIWNLEKYDAVAIGPAIGFQNSANFKEFLNASKNKKIVLDADAIILLGNNPELLMLLPENSILTPHIKEFKVLTGKTWENDFEKLEILRQFVNKHKIIVCLKGKNTVVALPDGSLHFNSTGNSGMATAGSGDVLTGIILGFLAQGYSSEQAAIQGVYEHGLAGDKAAQARSERAIIASDIIENFR